MSTNNVFTKLKNFRHHLTKSPIEFDLQPYQEIFEKIDLLKSDFEVKSDSELKSISDKLVKSAKGKRNFDDLLVEAFALVRETIWRVLKIKPFDVQIIGGIALYLGKLVEMQTGEGKTLTAVFPVYLNALTGKGVHVLTFNDYLARRDAQWMGPIYQFLGLSVGFIQDVMEIKDRQQAYNSDITYLTAKESGFDFLRDSLCYLEENTVHREFNYALIDEADSILIDEARIPLIIAGSSDDYVSDPNFLARIAKQLKDKTDFEFDEYSRNIHLTDQGLQRSESLLNCSNLYAEENFELLTRLNCAIHAEYLLNNEVDYIVRNGKVELVDEFTGRIADKRRWPDGLQAAIEAKENIAIQNKGNILNSITLQHFLQLYPKRSGMTATAQSATDELKQFYNLDTVVIPPYRPCIRVDDKDRIFQTKEIKNKALVQEIIKVHKTKRPILVGTQSIAESVCLAESLQQEGVKCEVLNAKQDEYEAQIIVQAGKLEAVTISTNMAGRGVDIKLGGEDEKEKNQVKALGGLYVIGTNKHESSRIDRQLRGRAGRQGDLGSSRFFTSLEDDLFIKYRLKELFPPHLILNGLSGEIDNPIVKKEINRIQRIIEGQNFEIKKTLFNYSQLIEKQRLIIFDKREKILIDRSDIDFYRLNSPDQFKKLESQIDKKELIDTSKLISLNFIDKFWSQYLADVADIREGIHLTRIGGQMPILEFHKRAIKLFENYQKISKEEMIRSFNKIRVKEKKIDLTKTGLKTPSATWTYLINDNPFENNLGAKLMGNMGLSIAAGIWGPLVGIYILIKKWKDKNQKST